MAGGVQKTQEAWDAERDAREPRYIITCGSIVYYEVTIEPSDDGTITLTTRKGNEYRIRQDAITRTVRMKKAGK
jgi:hypothetical protein